MMTEFCCRIFFHIICELMYLNFICSFILFRAADILRTTKLALLRARLRRRCFQYRKSHKSNNRQQLSKNETTLTFVKASKKEPKATVSIVKKMMHQQNKTVDR